jgi:hypothetical protein
MKVLVACKFSGIVRDAFIRKGHDAVSCDLLPTESPGPHIQGDVLEILDNGWDMMIAHPPCTYLSYVSTRSWNEPGRVWKRLNALTFFAKIWEAPIEKICIENPRGCASPAITKYSQEIQPYYFGDREMKTTWLWLKNLPLLRHNKSATLFEEATHTQKPEPYGLTSTGRPIYFMDKVKLSHSGKEWGHLRSRFWPGIAQAMADQWGNP